MTNIEKLDYLKLQHNVVETAINILSNIQDDIINDVVDILDEEERLKSLVNFCNTGKYIEEDLKPEDIYNFDFNPEWLDIFFPSDKVYT
jgi:hypothetical protein